MSNFSCYQDGKILMGIDRYSRSRDLENKGLPTRLFYGENLWGPIAFRNLIVDNPQYDTVLNGKRRLIRSLPHEKRVFISHRRVDEAKAKSIASILNKAKISYWLDVLDPTLSTNQSLSAIIIANIIEIALINCTHVIALMTNNSKGSQWIPYEYGRVKEERLLVRNTAAYVSNLHDSLPDYMELGDQFDNDQDMIRWLKK